MSVIDGPTASGEPSILSAMSAKDVVPRPSPMSSTGARIGEMQVALDRLDHQREHLPVDEGKDVRQHADEDDIPLIGITLARGLRQGRRVHAVSPVWMCESTRDGAGRANADRCVLDEKGSGVTSDAFRA
jgi:hypothetical protein